MGYIFLFFVIAVVFYSIFKMIRSGKMPSNHYTPFDDLTEGKVPESKDKNS
ncbi:hypothetical protein [Mesobacillus subterraneus]|uniref:hypothetical protein n=1 Tax=Mesobacillus subterraneus TaxID=285983 RepID=UPI001473B960|nr:hypothetical protein [Mesobacillus subterraneus]